MPTFEQKITTIKTTFAELAKSKNETGQHKMPLTVEDVVKDGVVVGARLLSAIEPTAQYLYVPTEGQDYVAGLTFPGDDAAYATQLALEVANAVRSAYPDLATNLVAVIAPKFEDGGVSFTHEGEEVYQIYKDFIVRRSEQIFAEQNEKQG